MNRKEVVEKSIELLSHSLEGFEVESPKIDFKRNWYDLSKKRGVNEFVKDTSAIANTIGLDGFIIIGYDDKEKEFFNTKFSESKISDSARIPDMIIKKCSEGFTVNTYDFKFKNHELSVIHIPPVLYKPIVILEYQKYDKNDQLKNREYQRVFVRKNSRNDYATKNDFELMYYDRKNIQADFDYFIDIIDFKTETTNIWRNSKKTELHNLISIQFLIENLGRRNLAIKKSYILVKTENKEFHLKAESIEDEKGLRRKVKSFICNINQNDNLMLRLLYSENDAETSIKNLKVRTIKVVFELSNGTKITKSSKIK